MNEYLLHSDETAMFRAPAVPEAGETVTIRFRAAAGDAESVWLVRGEARVPMEVRPAPWQKQGEASAFDYWTADIRLGKEAVCYHFEILRNGELWQYNRQGPVWVCEPEDEFRVVPGFTVPDWAKGAVFYQIFVDRFANGDPSNDVRTGEFEYLGTPLARAESWEEPVREPDVGRFYGGDLQGVIDKLDYLSDLGIEGIYLNPIFVSPSNHKYDTQDYDHVDPHLGKIIRDGDYVTRTTDPSNLEASDALLAKLIGEAHRRGIRVILDGVFNHCGSFHKWMDREGIYEEAARRANEAAGEMTEGKKNAPGAYREKTSPYRDYFRFSDEEGWPENASYEGWWDHSTLPKLNYEGSEKLRKEIFRIAKKWISPPYNADGWRLDVAADLGHSAESNHDFWRQFRKEVKKTRPDALIIAEHYGHAGAWLTGDQWDSVMNYDAFMEPVGWFLTGMEKHSDSRVPELAGDANAFFETVRRANAAFGGASLLTAMNELDNHDHSRFLTRTAQVVGRIRDFESAEAAADGADVAVLRQAVLVQMIWPGMPTLYYGNEAGLPGFTDPDDRRPFPWGREDGDLLKYYKKAIAMHRAYRVLRDGSFIHLPCFEPGGGEEIAAGVLAYGRFNAEEAVLLVMHTREEPAEVAVPAMALGEMTRFKRVFETGRDGWTDRDAQLSFADGLLAVALPAAGAVVIRGTAG